MLEREAAIVTPIAGTTRDVLEASILRRGKPYRLIDTAGLADDTSDPIEAIGMERALALIASADRILWLGSFTDKPSNSIAIHARADERPGPPDDSAIAVSIYDRESVDRLWSTIETSVAPLALRELVHFHDEARASLKVASEALARFDDLGGDPLAAAEEVRLCHGILARLSGVDATEAMLDALFGRFCIGK
ncbi:GTPase [Sphingomonas sp. MMS24-JH45]